MLLTLRIAAWRLRRVTVVVGVVLLASFVARQAAPPPEPTTPVVVASRALEAGTVLTDADVRVVRVPSRLVPDGGTPAAHELPGRQVTAAVPAGLPLVPGVLDGGRFAAEAPAGTVTVPVRLVDPAVAELLRPGDRVDLVAPGAGDLTTAPVAGDDGVLAAGALVLEVAAAPDDGGLTAWPGGASGGGDPLVVVAVAPDEGHRLAAAGWGSLGAVLVEGS